MLLLWNSAIFLNEVLHIVTFIVYYPPCNIKPLLVN